MSALKFKQTRTADRLEEMDRNIQSFATITQKKLLRRLLALGVNDKVKLSRSKHLTKNIRARLKKKDGEIERVAFTFLRQGIFIQRGVGRGRPVGSAPARQAEKPWLSTVLPPAVQELADLLEEEYGDIAVAELNFNIPGVMSSKSK